MMETIQSKFLMHGHNKTATGESSSELSNELDNSIATEGIDFICGVNIRNHQGTMNIIPVVKQYLMDSLDH